MSISEIGRRIRGRVGQARPATPFLASNTFVKPGDQWYLPALAGPSSFLPETVGAAAVRNALEVLGKLTPDRYHAFVTEFYHTGLERFGDSWVYADINTVLLGLSRRLRPTSYLEIGVRRGRSMAMLASQSPDCGIVGFDLWIENYAGMENPGEKLVRSELARVGYRGEAVFVAGDSRETVPRYLAENPGRTFDIITVDGDHSVEGARADLLNVIPRLNVGGVLVFDDIVNQDHRELGPLWDELVGADPQFASYSFSEVGFGVSLAVRKY
jgi:hypothetical protein